MRGVEVVVIEHDVGTMEEEEEFVAVGLLANDEGTIAPEVSMPKEASAIRRSLRTTLPSGAPPPPEEKLTPPVPLS